jgi:hypothetical protein
MFELYHKVFIVENELNLSIIGKLVCLVGHREKINQTWAPAHCRKCYCNLWKLVINYLRMCSHDLFANYIILFVTKRNKKKNYDLL